MSEQTWKKLVVPLPHPFRGARWLFYVCVVGWLVFYLFLMSLRPWQPVPWTAAWFALAATACLATWVNHVRLIGEGKLSGSKQVAIAAAWALYDLFLMSLLVIILSLALVLAMGTDESIMNDRQNVADLGREAKSYEREIEAKAMKQSSLAGAGHGMTIAPGKLIAEGIIGDDGVIVVRGENPPATVVLAPRLEAGKIVWTCNASTPRYERLACRE